ncbi:MAG: hypothetical protein KDA44_07840 [Planctomycetales bacterium]|nr:hypothetical protein [Planctomycetales bacterium]
MSDSTSCDPYDDPFHPPTIPTMVNCLHCGEQYDSYLIEWRIIHNRDGAELGFWCCPTPGCDGLGFGCDILPADPEWRDERGGWCDDDDADWYDYDDDDDADAADLDPGGDIEFDDDVPF